MKRIESAAIGWITIGIIGVVSMLFWQDGCHDPLLDTFVTMVLLGIAVIGLSASYKVFNKDD